MGVSAGCGGRLRRSLKPLRGDGMENFLYRLEQAVWSFPMLVLILGTGLYLTLRLRFMTLRRLPEAMGLLFRSGRSGGVSALGALCTSLSATVGTGNIVGVATALALGGPGALLWMEVSAAIGMAVKYAEGYFAVMYRSRAADGSLHGGPFAYITLGLGPGFRPLAAAFALFGAMAGLCGVGTFVQVGSVCACLTGYLEGLGRSLHSVPVLGRSVPVSAVILGLVFTVSAGLLIFGGIRRISRVSTVLMPAMGGLYVLCCLWILVSRCTELPGTVLQILCGAVRPSAAAGGLLGAMTAGVSRGVFSNEAGLGTAPIAAAAAENVTPREQGLISMTASVFDTFLICTLTGLSLLLTGTGGLGVTAAMDTFARGLPLPGALSRGLVLLCLALFSFTTVVGWSFYGAECLRYLFGDRPKLRTVYLSLYLLTVSAAPCFPVQSLWEAANICNGLMAVPNLIGILLLSPRLPREATSPDRRARRSRRTGRRLRSRRPAPVRQS